MDQALAGGTASLGRGPRLENPRQHDGPEGMLWRCAAATAASSPRLTSPSVRSAEAGSPRRARPAAPRARASSPSARGAARRDLPASAAGQEARRRLADAIVAAVRPAARSNVWPGGARARVAREQDLHPGPLPSRKSAADHPGPPRACSEIQHVTRERFPIPSPAKMTRAMPRRLHAGACAPTFDPGSFGQAVGTRAARGQRPGRSACEGPRRGFVRATTSVRPRL